MSESTVSSKGQITIPKAVRESLHLEPGDRVYFSIQADGSVIMRARNQPIESLFGLLQNKVKIARPVPVELMDPGSRGDTGS